MVKRLPVMGREIWASFLEKELAGSVPEFRPEECRLKRRERPLNRVEATSPITRAKVASSQEIASPEGVNKYKMSQMDPRRTSCSSSWVAAGTSVFFLP